MIEAFLGAVAAIALGMIANILTPYFQDLFINNPPAAPNVPDQENLNPDQNDLNAWRAQNRARAESIYEKVTFYLFAYGAMYFAFFIPMTMNGGLIDPSIKLIESKLAIDFVINGDNMSKICAIFGVLAFVPCWKLSQIIANVVASIVVRFTFINETKMLAFTVLAMILCAFFIAGNVSWVLSVDAGWIDSIKASLILWFVLMAFAIVKS